MGVQERFENKKRYQSRYGFDTSTRSGGVADRYERNKRYASVDTSGVDDEFINRFLKDSNDFVSSAKKDHDSLKWGNAATVHDSRYKSWQDLNGRSETIRAWMHKNRGSIDPDAAKQLGSYLDGFYKNGLSVMGAFGDVKDYYSQWDSEDAYDTYVKFNSVADPDSELYDPDFEAKSQYSSTKLDGFWDRFASPYGLGYGDLTYEYINGANNGLRDEIRYNESTFRSDTVGSKNYDQLTNDEIALYNYHYATGGKETAEAYLDSIQEELNRRSAQNIYTNLRGKPTAEMLYGAVVGAEQFGAGIKNLFNFTDKHIPATDTQIAGGMVREDLGTVGPELPKWLGGASLGQVGYDLVNTTANMAPSMVVGSLNPLAGTLTMGASASGNAYQEMLNKGYSKGQSRVYSALVGGSETGLQYLLGGIGKMGGKVSGNVVGKVLNNVDNAFARTAIKLGGNMLSEGLEEGVQEVLTPWFESITTGEGFELQSEDVLYSSLLGALTAGFLEGGNTISAEVNTYQTGKALQKAGIQASQVEDMSAGLPAGSFARQLASRVDENTGAYTLGRLFNEIGAEITEANQADIRKGLEQRGVRKKDAKTLAASFAAVAAGQSFSETQAAAIESNEDLAKTVVDVITDLKDTVNQRSQGYRDVLMHLTNKTPNTATGTTGSGNAVQEAVAQLAQKQQNVMSGQAVDASEGVSEALEEADGTIREVVRQMGGKDAAADVLVDAYHAEGGGDALVYAKGIEEAYTYGKANMPVRELLERGSFAPELTEHQVRTAYRLGQMAGGKLVAKEQAIARRSGGAGVAGKVHFDGDWGKLNEVQTQSLAAMETVADALGVQIHVFESEVDEDGKHIGDNGWYDPKDGSIHIDLHSGVDGQGAMLFTLSHELTHFMKQWSPAKYKVLTNFLMEQYGQNDVSVQELVDRQIAKAKRRGRELDFDGALEEVVADSMETMLSDGTVIEKLAQLKQQDRTLWQQMKDWLHEFAEKIRQAYRRLQPDSAEGRLVAQMKDSVERFQELFTEGLVDAGENFGGGAKNTAGEGGVKYNQRYLEADVNTDIIAMVKRVANGEFKANDKVYLGVVSDAVAEEIYDLTGIQVNGFRIAIEARQIDHILKGHGKNGDSDHSLADPDDIGKMEYVLTDPDDIRKAGKTQAYTYMRNGRNRTADTVLYEKNIGSKSYYVIQAVPDTKAKTLYVVTAFIGNSGYKNEASQLINAKGPDVTAKTGSVSAPISSIRDSGDFVKKFSLRESVEQTKDLVAVHNLTEKKLLFSSRDPDQQKVNEALEQENQKLREDVSYLKELVKLQRQVTGGTKFTRSSVEAAARILAKDSGAKGDVKELSAMLDRFYGYIASEKELTWEGVMEQAQKPVDWLMEHHVHRKERSEYADDILRQLRGTKVRLDESQMAEAAHRFGSYNDYRKSLCGNVTLSKDGTTTLDELWQELSAEYPAVFDSKTASGDMPGALADIIGRLRDEDISQVEYAENWAFIRQELLRQVYDSYWNVSTLRTVADVKQKQIDRLKEEHIQRMEKLRQSHREKIGQLKQEHRQELSKVRQEYRDRMDRKVQKTAQRYQEARKERIEGRKRTEVRTAYRLGQMADGERATAPTASKTNDASKIAWKRGTVKGYGVTIKQLNKAFNSNQKQAYSLLDRIAQVTGIDIVLFESKPDANGELRGGIVDGIDMSDSHGAFSWHNDKIYIDINAGVLKESEMGDIAKYSMLRTFSHEFTHFIEKHDADGYEQFRDLVFDVMRQNGVDPEGLLDAYMDKHPNVSRDDASREVVAEAMTDIPPESGFVQQLAERNKDVFQKLLAKLKEFVDRIKAHFKSIGYNSSAEPAAVKEHIDGVVRYAEEIVEMFDRIAVQAVENYQTGEMAQKNTTGEGGVRMQVRESFYKEFDAWDKKDTNKTFTVGTTSEALRSVGMKDQKIILRSGTILQKINKHKELSFEIFKGIPELLEHPVIVQFSDAVDPKTNKPKYDSRITVLGELYADGRPVLVSLELLPTNQKKTIVLDFATITSAYSKGALQQYLNENSILYIDPDKKRTDSWLSLNRLQLPLGENRYGPVRKITYADGKVKVQNPKNMTAMQKALQAAGVIDAYGNHQASKDGTEQHQHRTSTLTNRDIIAQTEGQNDLERKKLEEYREKLAASAEQSQRLAELNKELDALKDSSTPEDKAKIAELRKEVFAAKNKREIYDNQLRRMENGVLDPIITREKGKILQQLRERYGTIPKGEKAVRDDSLPVSVDGETKVSRTARTVKGAGVTPEDFAELIDKEVVKGGLSYIPVSNDKATQKATERIKREGWEDTRVSWAHQVRSGMVSAELSATGALLLNNAARAGDRKAWLDILHDYQHMGTAAGQAVQALTILKRLQPDDKLYTAKRSISQMVEDMKLGYDIEIDPELEKKYLNAKGEEEQNRLWDEITKSVAQQLPTTFLDKWTALRYTNMLGNPRTQIRNLAGNVAMKGVSGAKDLLATGLENLAYRASGGKFRRTKSITVSEDLLKAAKADFVEVEDLVQGGGKYSTASAETARFAAAVKEQQRIFKSKLLEGYRKKTSWAMEAGDLLFSRSAYARALAGYLKANGVQDSDFSKINPWLLNDARLYAVREAQEVTFRDTNALSGWISKIGRDEKTPKAARWAIEGILPFRKTPANVLVRAEEYSPLGLINAAVLSLKAAGKDSEISGSQVIDSWSKSLTGTGLFALGILLSNAGILIGGPDDDDGLESFESLNGQQNYSLKIGDVYITVDWLSPAAIPLFMGAQLQRAAQDGGIELKELGDALSAVADPMIEMSMLQGLNDALNNVKYSEYTGGQFVIDAMTGYLTQGLTNTLLGQIERGFEGQRMSTYADKDSALPVWMQKAMGKASAKTLGWDYNQIPYINAWGEEEQNPDVILNTIYNMLSPFYISKGEEDAVSQELTQLNEVNSSDRSVFPKTPEKTLTFTDSAGVEHTDYNLSGEEYVALAKEQGQTQRRIIESMVGSDLYQGLPDQYRIKAVQLAYDYAREHAQIQVLGRDGFSSDWMAEIQGDTAEGIVTHVIAQNIKGMYLSGYITADEAIQRRIEYHGDGKEEAAGKIAYWDQLAKDPNADVESAWFTTYQEKVADSGIDVDTYVEYRQKKSGYDKKADVLKVIDGMDLTDAQKDSLYLAEGYAESKLHEAPWN